MNGIVLVHMLPIVLLKTIKVAKFEYDFIHTFKGVAHLRVSKGNSAGFLECQWKEYSDS